MKPLILVLLVALAVLHQDFWWRADHRTVVLGFVPVSLAYHVGVSIAATVLWGLACVYLWPKHVDVAPDLVCSQADCRFPNNSDARFCAYCGKPLGSAIRTPMAN